MQEIASPTPAAAPTKPKAAPARTSPSIPTDSSGRPIAYTGNNNGVATSGNVQTAGAPVVVSNTGNTSAIVSNTGDPSVSVTTMGRPSVTVNNMGNPSVTADSRQSQSDASLDRSKAVQSSSPTEAVQQTVQMLQWFVQEASQLPTAARLEALRCGLPLYVHSVSLLLYGGCDLLAVHPACSTVLQILFLFGRVGRGGGGGGGFKRGGSGVHPNQNWIHLFAFWLIGHVATLVKRNIASSPSLSMTACCIACIKGCRL